MTSMAKLLLALLLLQSPVDLVNVLQIDLDRLRTTLTPPTITVRTADVLQTVLNTAPSGTTIRLQPGTYNVNLVLPAGKSGIVIRSDAPDPILSKPWVQPSDVNNAWATLLPLDPSLPVIATQAGAHDYLLQMLEIGPNLALPDRALIYLGDFNQSSLSQVPNRIDIDRCYIHGSDAHGGLRGVSLNTQNSTISRSYISNFWFEGQDSQAIGIYTGPGPYLISNNYLEGSGENILIGGVDTRNAGMTPSDITVTGNYFYKPQAWRSKPGSVKNLFELKNARRASITYNVFDGSWIDAQVGHGIVFTVRDQNGTAPWTTISDVVFRGNIVKNVEGSAFNLLGLDDTPNKSSLQGLRVTIDNNLILGANRGLQSSAGFRPTTFTHNTVIGCVNTVVFFYGTPFPAGQFWLTDNVLAGGMYGIFGDAVGSGTPAFTTFAPQSTAVANVIEGAVGPYPAGNYPIVAGALAARLDALHHYLGTETSTDGRPLGADVDDIMRRIPWAIQ